MIASYDIDGVIFLPEPYTDFGIVPPPAAFIITGRSEEEREETEAFLAERNIPNHVYFNPLPFDKKDRYSSGKHKADTILLLRKSGYDIGLHIDDDPIQLAVIQAHVPNIKLIRIDHGGIINLENMRQKDRA